jgi:hypothetical protein
MKYPYKIQKTITGRYELVREFDDEVENIIRSSLPRKYQSRYNKATLLGSKIQVDLPEVGIRELEQIFYDAWNNTSSGASRPVVVFGGSGIGKSDTVFRFGQNVARDIPAAGTKRDEKNKPLQHRKFIDISDLESDDEESFQKVVENVGDYFLFYLINGSDVTPDNLRGIYKVTGEKKGKGISTLEGNIPKYLKLMMQKDAVGILFLDEVNQAGENQRLLYQLLLGHRISQYKINKEIRIIGAGNIGEGYGPVISNLTPAAIGRTNAVYLTVSPKDWVEYVRSNKYENMYGDLLSFPEVIISFLFSGDNFESLSKTFYKEPGEPENPSSQAPWPNPRSIEQFGQALNNILSELKYKNKNKPLKPNLPSREVLTYKGKDDDLIGHIEGAASSICGTEWGRQFNKFFYYAYYQNIDQIIASDFTREGEGGKRESLDPEEYWAKGYIISTYFSKLANTYKQMDDKTLYEHFYKLASALFKYIPVGSPGNLKEYLKKVSQDMNGRDGDLFARFLGYLGNFQPRNEKEKATLDRFIPEMMKLTVTRDELKAYNNRFEEKKDKK